MTKQERLMAAQAKIDAASPSRARQTAEPLKNLLAKCNAPSMAAAAVKCSACDRLSDSRLMLNGICPRCNRAANERKLNQMRWRAESGIDPRHAKMKTWDDLMTEVSADAEQYATQLKLLKAFLNSPTASVLGMIGDRGTGKTQLASVAVNMAIDRGRPARIIRTADLLTDHKARWGEHGGEAAWVEEWVAPWLLVLDEFAERADNDWSSFELTRLVDKRYGKMLKTVIIANLNPTAYCRLAGRSIADRANEGGGVLLFDWASFRPAIGPTLLDVAI